MRNRMQLFAYKVLFVKPWFLITIIKDFFQISGLITPLCLPLCGYEITYPKGRGTIALSAPDYPEKRENARTNIRAIRMP